jgi:hypothetical protein
MSQFIAFLISLGVLALAGRELAAAGRALRLPASAVSLLMALALR